MVAVYVVWLILYIFQMPKIILKVTIRKTHLSGIQIPSVLFILNLLKHITGSVERLKL